MNKLIYTLSALLLLSACNSGEVQLPLDQAPLHGATIGGDYKLTDQNGKLRSRDEFKGKWRIVYFGYTSCPDICQPDMQNLMGGLNMFAIQEAKLAENIQPIFISVDPKRDTPDVLKQYVGAFHDRLIGLTGSEEELKAVAKKFAVIFNIVPSENNTEESYLVSHTQTPYLFDPDGNPVALLPADKLETEENEGRPELVANELAKWVR